MDKTTNTSPSHHGAKSRNCVASRDRALAKSKCQERGNLLRVATKDPATGRGGPANTKEEERHTAGTRCHQPGHLQKVKV